MGGKVNLLLLVLSLHPCVNVLRICFLNNLHCTTIRKTFVLTLDKIRVINATLVEKINSSFIIYLEVCVSLMMSECKQIKRGGTTLLRYRQTHK